MFCTTNIYLNKLRVRNYSLMNLFIYYHIVNGGGLGHSEWIGTQSKNASQSYFKPISWFTPSHFFSFKIRVPLLPSFLLLTFNWSTRSTTIGHWKLELYLNKFVQKKMRSKEGIYKKNFKVFNFFNIYRYCYWYVLTF